MDGKTLYFDYNATTPMHSEVLEAMYPYFCEEWGNPSSSHFFGRKSKDAIEVARACVAELLGAKSSEIIFTAGGTAANNIAIKGLAHAAPKSRNQIITSKIEHSSVYHACMSLKKIGFEVHELPVDRYGRVIPDSLPEVISSRTALLSVMLANNELGTIQPIREFAEIANRNHVPFHCDAIQAVGKMPVSVDDLGVDMLTISGHKLYGPNGCGAIYIRNGLKLSPLHHGGNQERGLQPGTENVPAIVGMGKACEIAMCHMLHNNRHLRKLLNLLERKLFLQLPAAIINGHPEERLPNTMSICIPGIPNDILTARLDQKGIAVSSGTACSSSPGIPSRVLQACGRSIIDSLCSIRISLGLHNAEEDIDTLVHALIEVVSCEQGTKNLYS